MIRRLLARLLRSQRAEKRPTPGEAVRSRKADAQVDLLAGKGMTSRGELIDFERDSKKP